jgi:hypothetical protein
MLFCVRPVFEDSFSHNTIGHFFIIFSGKYGRRCSQRSGLTAVVISEKLATVAKIQRPVSLDNRSKERVVWFHSELFSFKPWLMASCIVVAQHKKPKLG